MLILSLSVEIVNILQILNDKRKNYTRCERYLGITRSTIIYLNNREEQVRVDFISSKMHLFERTEQI